MEIERIGLDKLTGHGANSNVMSCEVKKKLRGHIERHGFYEPLVVRAHRKQTGFYELLNGHHRREVLAELGYECANCVVWDVSDDEALMLLATLNRLGGSDDPYRRGRLLEDLSGRYASKEMLRGLPERREQMAKLLELDRAVRVVEPADIAAAGRLQAMSFFVTVEQKAVIEKALCKAMGTEGLKEKVSRGERLFVVSRGYMGDK